MGSIRDELMRRGGAPSLLAVRGEETDDGADLVVWYAPSVGNAIAISRPVMGHLVQTPSFDPRSGETVLRERRDVLVRREDFATHGVTGPQFEARMILPDGEWHVDPSESVWGAVLVKLALARKPLVRQQEMRDAGV